MPSTARTSHLSPTHSSTTALLGSLGVGGCIPLTESRKERLKEPRSHQEHRMPPSHPPTPLAGQRQARGLPFLPCYCLNQAPGEECPSPPVLWLPTHPTESAGWSCRAQRPQRDTSNMAGSERHRTKPEVERLEGARGEQTVPGVPC